ncbi:MAG: class IV adenylate cyclase [Gemmataceae bacterium]
MAQNVEIKASIKNYSRLADIVSKLADEGPDLLNQEDTFFNCPHGRLKLRKFSENQGELIFYKRDNLPGPKLSEYQILPTNNPVLFWNILAASLGVIGVVRKKRTLFKIAQTRIHLDHVEGLGDFLELEVVLNDHQGVDFGESIAKELLERLEIKSESLMEKSYLELLLEKGA